MYVSIIYRIPSLLWIQWTYACLLKLDKPVPPDHQFILRNIYRHVAQVRSNIEINDSPNNPSKHDNHSVSLLGNEKDLLVLQSNNPDNPDSPDNSSSECNWHLS